MLSLLHLLASLASARALGLAPHQISSLVTFGDSYTDVVNVGDGGTAWPVYATGYSHTQLFPFAKSGATCSNNITSRPFPSVFESQLPTYFAEKENGTLPKLSADKTLFSLWIGTNDVGSNSLLTDTNNGTLVEVTECMVNWVKVLYDSGARNFLFQNMIPLNQVPIYSLNSHLSKFWAAPRNSTEWSFRMKELVLSGNMLTKLMLTQLAPTLKGAHVGIFDSHSLFADMLAHPANYLNGTAPLNITGEVNTCVFNDDGTLAEPCVLVNGTDRDSYLWFDELHPSEQADRVVAKNIAEVITTGKNKWTTWLS